MAEFSIKIAGHTARVCSLFESTPQYFRAYLTEETPEFFFTVTTEDLTSEQERLRQEALQEGMRTRVFPDPFLERSVIQQKFAQALLPKDILLLHGSTVAADGKAYLFTAKCGTGKSTHTRLWRELLGTRAVMVNDDKPFLCITPDGVLACGSPWSGKHGLDTNITVPLGGICILERGPENNIRPISAPEALPFLLTQCDPPEDAAQLPLYHKLMEDLAVRVPLWHMHCTKDLQAAQIAFDAMQKP